MYWIHRFGRSNTAKGVYLNAIELQAACYLLEHRNCFTVGWLVFSAKTENYRANIIEAVEGGYSDKIMNLMLDAGINRGWARSLSNFTKMQPDDIIVIIPYQTAEVDEYFIVKIKTPAQNILNSSSTMTAPFNVSGVDFNFNPNSGWQYLCKNVTARFDVGFFHEVEILHKGTPRRIMSNEFRYIRNINSLINDVSKQKFIDSFIKSE